jgi:hypothetical protein
MANSAAARTRARRSRATQAATAGATTTNEDEEPAGEAPTAPNAMMATLAGLDPATLNALIEAAQRQQAAAGQPVPIAAAQQQQAAAGQVAPPPAVRVLDPVQTQMLMAGTVAAPAAATHGAANGGDGGTAQRVTFDLPDNPIRATLANKLKEMARVQQDEAALVDFLTKQGKEKPQNTKAFGEWMSRVGEAVPVMAMTHDDPCVQVITNVVHYAAASRDDRKWDGKWMGALGDRTQEGDNPPVVRLKPSYFEWRQVNLPTDKEDSGPVATHYDTTEGELFQLEDNQAEADSTWVPKLALMPAKIALDAMELEWQPWDVYEALVEFENEKTDQVKQLLGPCKNWALASSIRGASAETSKMAYAMTAIAGAPAQVAKEMSVRMNNTLGENIKARPGGGAPSFNEQNVKDIAEAAIKSIMDSRQSGSHDREGDFQSGVLTAMRMMKDNESEGATKPFSDILKGKIMGFCGTTKWSSVQQIWAEVEKVKSDEDLRALIQKHWRKNEMNLNTMFYGVYWSEDLIKSIRKGTFTTANVATYRTSESALSMLALMPRTEEERIEIEQEYQRRKDAGKNVTTGDLKAAARKPRMPPTRWEEVLMLLTTWALLLEMLFGERNQHLQGINAIRRHLMSLAETKHCYNAAYFANVVWACVDDSVRYFNQVMPHEHLELASGLDIIQLQFPTSRLHDIAKALAIQSDFKVATFPREWDEYVQRGASSSYPATVSFGGGSSASGNSHRSTGSGMSGLTSRSNGSNSQIARNEEQPGAHDKNNGYEKPDRKWRDEHSDRYKVPACNPDIPQKIKGMITGLGQWEFSLLEDACEMGHYKMKMCENIKEGVCPAFATGKCTYEHCTARHLYGCEMPRQWVDKFCQMIEPGCKKIKNGEEIRPRKKFRTDKSARGRR